MKRSILLILVSILSCTAQAQQALRSVVFNQNVANNVDVAVRPVNKGIMPTSSARSSRVGARTTTWGGQRWYRYVDSILYLNAAVADVAYTQWPIWNDTASWSGYMNSSSVPTYYGNTWTSMGITLDPRASAWNDPTSFTGDIGVALTDAYTIDSVEVFGLYGRNFSTAAKNAVVDTLIIAFIQDGTGTTDLAPASFVGALTLSHYPEAGTSLDFYFMRHDSLNNRAAHGDSTSLIYTGTSTGPIYKFPLTLADTAMGDIVGNLRHVFPRSSAEAFSYTLSDSRAVNMSLTFKTGDTAWHFPVNPAFRDTVERADGTFKYGGWNQIVGYASTGSSSTTAAWPPYTHFDMTSGYFKKEGADDVYWAGIYRPNWGWSTSGGTAPSQAQYPVINFHITCATCGVLPFYPPLSVNNVTAINNVQAYPNPAIDQLNITFATSRNVTATVSLINMVGQTVASQSSNGKATFHTSAMAAGVYMYVVEANGTRTTGRVAVAH